MAVPPPIGTDQSTPCRSMMTVPWSGERVAAMFVPSVTVIAWVTPALFGALDAEEVALNSAVEIQITTSLLGVRPRCQTFIGAPFAASVELCGYRVLPFNTNEIAARSEMVDRTARWSLTSQHCSMIDNNALAAMKLLVRFASHLSKCLSMADESLRMHNLINLRRAPSSL